MVMLRGSVHVGFSGLLFGRIRCHWVTVATMNILVTEAGPERSLVTTETRVFANSGPARRRFAAYWRVIYPGSGLIRRMWLRAIQRRATAPGRTGGLEMRRRGRSQ